MQTIDPYTCEETLYRMERELKENGWKVLCERDDKRVYPIWSKGVTQYCGTAFAYTYMIKNKKEKEDEDHNGSK